MSSETKKPGYISKGETIAAVVVAVVATIVLGGGSTIAAQRWVAHQEAARSPLPTPVASTALVLEQDEPAETKPVVFSFDDGYESIFLHALPLFEQYNIKGVAYITVENIGKPGYLHREQLQALVDAGWEIGSHGYHHEDFTKLSPEDLTIELSASKAWLMGFGANVYSIASPYGEYNDAVVAEMAKYYLSHRTAWPDGLNHIDSVDPMRLRAVSPVSSTTVATMRGWVKRAVDEEGVLIVALHRIGEEGEYNWEADQLRELIEYVVIEEDCAGEACSAQE